MKLGTDQKDNGDDNTIGELAGVPYFIKVLCNYLGGLELGLKFFIFVSRRT